MKREDLERKNKKIPKFKIAKRMKREWNRENEKRMKEKEWKRKRMKREWKENEKRKRMKREWKRKVKIREWKGKIEKERINH